MNLLSAYGYANFKSLALSLFPSFKYGAGSTAIGISSIFGIAAQLFGFSPLLAAAMFVTLVIETMTGIQASRKKGEHFESWKFSRCILKVGIWLAIFFILHSFSRECSYYDGIVYILAAWAFDALHALAMVFFCIENTTSILENLSVIDGKEKTAYIEAVQDIWHTLVDNLKNMKKQ